MIYTSLCVGDIDFNRDSITNIINTKTENDFLSKNVNLLL